MTLGSLLHALLAPDHLPKDMMASRQEVVFDTSGRGGLHLLSVYYGDDGKIHIDIGEDGE